MDAASLAKAASEIELLAAHVDYLVKIAKPCVDIELVDDAPTAECSRFCGAPFVPSDFDWPTRTVGEYRFLGQFNFAEIQNPPAALPQAGLLSIFYAFDEDGECFWGDDGYVRAFFWEDLSNHVLIDSPTKNNPATRRIKLTAGLDLPRHTELRSDWPFEDEDPYSPMWQLNDACDRPSEYMLGYPSFTTLAFDPTPGPEWMSLLTLYSLHEFNWCWNDGDKLMIFIEMDKLAKKDFSSLNCGAG